ncbi:MAG: LysE family translocator [Anaerolineales bacterium]
MSLPIFLQSLVIGFSIAAPVGPIGIICIRRTLDKGRWSGLISGLGAATADALYGSIAAFGLAFISTFLINQSTWLRLGGGIFLIFLGMRVLFSAPVEYVAANPGLENHRNLLSDYLSTFLLTISNPLTILSFAAIFTGLGAVYLEGRNYTSAVLMILGIFLGSCSWWFVLTYITSLIRNRINIATMRWVNRIAGAIITIFGIIALISVQMPFSIN